MKTVTAIHHVLASSLFALALAAGPVRAQPERVVIIGDSISEGVQSGDAGWTTQALTYGTWVTFLLGSPDSIPYLNQSLTGVVGNPAGRNRFVPDAITDNVAVSGATLGDVLRARANATSEAQIDDELDLVLYPRLQTQIEYAESAPPEYILCWIGNNDVLSAALSFSAFDASQLTPVAQFDQDFVELADRLKALHDNFGTRTVFANIPSVTDIGFLVDRTIAEAALGFPVNLSEGSYTSVVAVLLMGIFGNDGLLNDPAFVLNPAEVAAIQDRIAVFNGIIDREATRIGMPVVDTNARFADFVANPPVIAGVPLTNTFLGGLFSLDGVHPNNIAHALIANEFIKTMQNEFGTPIGEIPPSVLEIIALTDPHVDKDSDGQVGGRFGAGLLESVALLLGITGDADEAI
jgi:lysophospholipase L1-like esterase